MPHMSGVELAKQIRSSRPRIRVLYVSGYAEKMAGDLEVHEPGVGFLAKPFSRDALGRKLREILGLADSA